MAATWKPYPISYHAASALRNLVSSSLPRSHQRLMMAVSYNLWSSADHRCWSVGWGAFLIDTNVGGRDATVWYRKRLALLQKSAFTTRSHGQDRKRGGAEGNPAPRNCSQWQMGPSYLYYTCAADMEVNRGCSGSGNCSIMKGIGQCLP